jgi:exopolyphosphatase/guanosine-5'-triphosphate,3'-diphosphate pyrophosphatase
VIIDLHERLAVRQRARPGDMRDRTVVELQRRFGVDAEQAGRVRSIALTLHEQARPGDDADTRRELGWACDLHEVGLMVSHHDHHRHSAYLLDHADAPGFSQSQQRRIGELVLGQRGGLRKIESPLAGAAFAWQVLCLRLAVIKCHARGPVDRRALSLQARGREAHLGFTAHWAETHPRTLFLLREEAEAWARSGVLKLVLP